MTPDEGTATVPARSASIHTPQGEPLVPAQLLGRGGEARVYALQGDRSRAIKIYDAPARERSRKLAAMLANVPEDADRNIGHVSIAWPEALALDADETLVGFVMPRIDSEKNLPLHQLYNPGSRRTRAPGISWRYLVRIGRNLSSTLAALHEAGYVVGDLNESNILVNDRALVSLVDLDSIQVKTTMHVFRCNVGKVEYTPPELQAKSFRNTTRSPSSDRFGLAVLVFLLLMEGNHPFSGIYTGSGDPPGLAENIRARRSPYFGGRGVRPSPSAPSLELLPESLRTALSRALTGPAWRRPGARSMASELAALEEQLVDCSAVPTHAYPRDLASCPWCRRAQMLGRDPFPPRTAGTAPGSPGNSEVTVDPGARTGRSAVGGATGVAPRSDTRISSPPLIQPTRRQHERRQNGRPQQGRPQQGRQQSSRRPPTGPAQPGQERAQKTAPTTVRHERSGSRTQRNPGFQGTLPQFQRRLGALTVALLAVSALPIVVWSGELQQLLAGLGASWPIQAAIATAGFMLPAAVVAYYLFARSRRSPGFARGVLVAERLLRAAVLAALVSFAVNLAVTNLSDIDATLSLQVERLLLAALWLITTSLLFRFLGPTRF